MRRKIYQSENCKYSMINAYDITLEEMLLTVTICDGIWWRGGGSCI